MRHFLLGFLWIYLWATNLSPGDKNPLLAENATIINWRTINATGTVFSKDNQNYSLCGCIPQSPIGIIEPDNHYGLISGFWSSECDISIKAPDDKNFFLAPQQILVFKLHQNSPNPFKKTTKIAYDLPNKTKVTIEIFDACGRKVKKLLDGLQDAGRYSVNWSGEDETGRKCASGIYFYSIKTDNNNDIKKLLIAK